MLMNLLTYSLCQFDAEWAKRKQEKRSQKHLENETKWFTSQDSKYIFSSIIFFHTLSKKQAPFQKFFQKAQFLKAPNAFGLSLINAHALFNVSLQKNALALFEGIVINALLN